MHVEVIEVAWGMVFNATFNNISVISWRSVLLVDETGLSGENRRHAAIHWQTLSHNVVSSTPRIERDSNSIGTDCTDHDNDDPFEVLYDIIQLSTL